MISCHSAPHYAVMGNPITHSLSPRIHTEFSKQTGIPLTYSAILVPLEGFAAAVNDFQVSGGSGLNVTLPFKEQAFQLAPLCSDRATLARAVNTLIFEKNNIIRGDNTDGVGLLRDLTINHCISLQSKRILIVGAGGATRGILHPLLSENPAQLFIVNRTKNKALLLETEFKRQGNIQGGGFDLLKNQQFDLIINATAASLENKFIPLPDHLLSSQGCCYDLAYNHTLTPFLKWGRQQNARQLMNGLGMLVEQAAEAFYCWHGVRPDTKAIINLFKN